MSLTKDTRTVILVKFHFSLKTILIWLSDTQLNKDHFDKEKDNCFTETNSSFFGKWMNGENKQLRKVLVGNDVHNWIFYDTDEINK